LARLWQDEPSALGRHGSAGDLSVLAWRRTRTPEARANSAIFAMLRSKASRSISSAGVSTSATGAPIPAGGGFIRLRVCFGRYHMQWPIGLSMTRFVAAIAPALAHPIYKGMPEHKVTLRWERGGAEFS